MKRIYLLRHAKAVGKDEAPDFDRVLAPHGRDQMGRMAHHLAQEHAAIDLALVSSSARTRETWSLARLPAVPAHFDDLIYDADADALLRAVQGSPDAAATVILVGHNPGIHDLARQLVGFGDRHAAVRRLDAFPTGSLALYDVAVETWREVRFGSARLVAFTTPASLGGPGRGLSPAVAPGWRHMASIAELAAKAGAAATSIRLAGEGLFQPSLRLGVTGLSRAGKTVFTTALVHHLTRGTALPAFRAAAEGRIRRARLAHQPDDDVPRFAYEAHLDTLIAARRWPGSTTQIQELRLDIDYERTSRWRGGPATLALDIVDYPGEWLLDLALLDTSFADWSRDSVAQARRPDRIGPGAAWLAGLATLDPAGPADEALAGNAAAAFRLYLGALRAGPEAVATTPPGRFLMPGDLAGSPALTFAPLDMAPGAEIRPGTLAGLMQRRFESYKSRVVQPFFRDHFARIDRQIVLVDVLAAVDGGPAALAELEDALDRVLLAFNAGRNTFLSRLFAPRAERVLFAATKADHVHHTSHDRLERLLRHLVQRAVARTEGAGARVGTVALASVRATRETSVQEGRTILKAVSGTPEAGERIGADVFDGETEAAIYPGELPADPKAVLDGAVPAGSLRFPRFRPPAVPIDAAGRPGPLPQIRLDRALEFLLGDRLV